MGAYRRRVGPAGHEALPERPARRQQRLRRKLPLHRRQREQLPRSFQLGQRRVFPRPDGRGARVGDGAVAGTGSLEHVRASHRQRGGVGWPVELRWLRCRGRDAEQAGRRTAQQRDHGGRQRAAVARRDRPAHRPLRHADRRGGQAAEPGVRGNQTRHQLHPDRQLGHRRPLPRDFLRVEPAGHPARHDPRTGRVADEPALRRRRDKSRPHAARRHAAFRQGGRTR